jgi:hypothetical protein
VEIEATAKEHCYFTGWTGTAVEAGKVGEPDDPRTTVLMDADYALRANFAADRHTLVVTSTGGGVVYIVATGNEFLEQGLSDRAFRLDYGTKVLLMAIPQPEYQFQNFASWSGSFYGTMSCWEFSLEEDWYLMATFVPEPAP